MRDTFIVSAVRTPTGKFLGALSSLKATELGSMVVGEAIARAVSRELIESRPPNLWRYREFLPIEGEPSIGLYSGCTPLVKADRLARELGVKELYVKDDSVNHPTFSYKDRVVSVAISKAIEFGFKNPAVDSRDGD